MKFVKEHPFRVYCWVMAATFLASFPLAFLFQSRLPPHGLFVNATVMWALFAIIPSLLYGWIESNKLLDVAFEGWTDKERQS